MKNSGQSLVELLVAVALSTILLPAIFSGFASTREGRVQQNRRLVATSYMQEVKAAMRSVREDDWDNIATNGIYHPEISSGQWVLVAGAENIGDYTRSVTIGDTLRDGGGQIVSTGGTLDPSTKQVVVDISWPSVFPSSISSIMYLTRYLDNQIVVETTEVDFSFGGPINVAVTNNSGGEVELGVGGNADWCEPNLSEIPPINLPKQGQAKAIWATEGTVFVGTGENASGVSFANITVDNNNPPNASIVGTFDGFKTNDVYGESNFAYLATDVNNKEVIILDVTALPYTEVGFFDSPGPKKAKSLSIVGQTGYVISADDLFVFDLSSKVGSRPQLGSISLAEEGKELMVVGNYAYVATESSGTQLQVIDVSDPANMSVVAQANVGGEEGEGVFVSSDGTRVYLVVKKTGGGSSKFFILDSTNKQGNLPIISSYDTQGMKPKGISVVPDSRAIIVGDGGEEYQVIDITDENNTTRCGGLDLPEGINGIHSVLEADGDAFSYIISKESDTEFRIIEGGPGGSSPSSGDFESQIIDAGTSVTLNRFDATFTEPVNTDIKFQIGTADAIAGSCSGVTLTYTGPDADSGTFYQDSSPIARDSDSLGYENPAQCFGYKAFFETFDQVSTPVLLDMTINFSP